MNNYFYVYPYYRVIYYMVQQGDSLYTIAEKFSTTISKIMNANNLSSDLIYPGQWLIIYSNKVPVLPDRIYGIGNVGPDIVKIQGVLSILGFDIAQDGIYGSITSNTIMDFQKKFPETLIVDGIYGPKTKMYLEKLLSSDYKIVKNPESRTVLVNKFNSLPSSYVPMNLTVPNVPFSFEEFRQQKLMQPEAAKALEEIFVKAKEDDIALNAISGYRSYEYQNQIFSRNIKANPFANQTSARPGESEHQTGLAMDVSSPSVNNNLTQDFANTEQGKRLAKNAPDFGFILRFPKGKEDITGYEYEPWHIRYVGKEVAKQIANQNITLEEYLGQTIF